MVAINKILLPECTGGGCGGDSDICTDSRAHRRSAESRAPATRSHRRTQPLVNNLYQGMTLGAVTGLYYERNRDYSPSLGRWMEQDPVGYAGRANLYEYVGSSPANGVDPMGCLPETDDLRLLELQGEAWLSQGDQYAGRMMLDFAGQLFSNGNSGNAFQGIYHEILKSAKYRRAAQAYFQKKAEQYGKPGTYKLAPMIPPTHTAFLVDFKPNDYFIGYALNYDFDMHLGDLGIALGVAHFGYESATLKITGCRGHLRWRVSADMMERNRYHFHYNFWGVGFEPIYSAGYELEHTYGLRPFYQQSAWSEAFSGWVSQSQP